MNWDEFAFDPALYGLPTRRQLQQQRCWDDHYHGLLLNGNDSDAGMDKQYALKDWDSSHRRLMPFVNRMGVERLISLDIGGVKNADFCMEVVPERDAFLRKLLADESDHLSGLTRIHPGAPEKSCQKMEKWVRNGPCIGIKYLFGLCDGPGNDPIIQLAAELDAVVYIHTWLVVGGTPRRIGGGTQPDENKPTNVVNLAKRYPHVPLICGHSGGDWEIAVGIVRDYPNVYLEFAGSDSHSGQVDYAVKELGAERITWGGHGPSRSYATEMSKVLDADLTPQQRRLIFGGNYRRLSEKIFRRKGWSMRSRWGVT